MVCTWNPSDIGSAVALSLANLKWTSSNSGQVCGRATLGYLAGTGSTNANLKLYHEQTVNVPGSSGHGAEMGIANPAQSLSDYLGDNLNSTCVEASTGKVFYNTGTAWTLSSLIAGSGVVVGQYTDFVHAKLWWTIDGINFYGDPFYSGAENPSTNAGGMGLAASVFAAGGVYKTVYPAFGSQQSGPAGTANFKGPFALPVAAGFSAWDPTPSAAQSTSFFFAA